MVSEMVVDEGMPMVDEAVVDEGALRGVAEEMPITYEGARVRSPVKDMVTPSRSRQ